MTHPNDGNEPPLLYAVTDEPRPTEPPHNHDAEQATLGAALIDAHARDALTALLDPDDFYTPRHELIYDALITLHAAGTPVDVVTVAEHLQQAGSLARAGGAPYIAHLISIAPPGPTATWHAQIVADYAARRRIQQAANKIADQASRPGSDLDDLTATALHQLQQATARATTGQTPSTWRPVDLGPILDGTLADTPAPTILPRADGPCLLYAGAVHSIAGEPESGKTWVAIRAAVTELAAGNTVLYVDFEDRATRIVNRFLAAGATPNQIRDQLRYIRPDTALTATTTTHLEHAAHGATLAVIDGITEAMTLHGLSLLDNEDVARWLALMPRRLADHGPAVLQIDHVIKNAENRGRYAIGGQHKLAGIDGAAYKVTVTEPFGRGKKGHARITLDKDREGHVRAIALGHTVAVLTIDARDTERHTADQLRIYLDPPTADVGPDGAFRPTHLMESVSRYVEVNPGCTGKTITDTIRGNTKAIRDGLAALVREGYLRTEPGIRNAVHHWSERPFREDDQ